MTAISPFIIVFSVTVYLSGHLKSHQPHETVANRKIILKADQTVVGTAQTDVNGDFQINFTDTPETKHYHFFYIKKNDTLHLQTFSSFENETPEVTIYLRSKK